LATGRWVLPVREAVEFIVASPVIFIGDVLDCQPNACDRSVTSRATIKILT